MIARLHQSLLRTAQLVVLHVQLDVMDLQLVHQLRHVLRKRRQDIRRGGFHHGLRPRTQTLVERLHLYQPVKPFSHGSLHRRWTESVFFG